MQHAALRQCCGTDVDTRACCRTGGRNRRRDRGVTAELRQRTCHQDNGCLADVVGFYDMCMAPAHAAAPLATGSD